MEPEHSAHYENMRPPKKKRPYLKFFISVIIAIGLFSLGVVVGRGDIRVNGLSQTRIISPSSTFDYSSVDEVYSLLKDNFDGKLDKNKLLWGIKAGLVSAAGDPYTEYFNPEDAADFDEELSGSFTGIGAELGTDSDNNIVVVSPLSGYPAEKAGLKPKDVIAAVNGQSTTDMSVDGVVRKIRGPSDTNVTLTIIRGNDKPFNVTIKRAKITVPSVRYSVIGNIGYIKISQFTNDTVGLVQQAAKEFKQKDVKAVVLDLRGDPGGFLDGAVQISSMWLPQGKTVVSERRGTTILATKYSKGSGEFQGLPTVVLIDGGSASASEITAGALHDNGAATLVGIKSFGKGSVQQIEHFSDGSELKVTIAHWYTPEGKNINKQGITPDTVVKIPEAASTSGNDPQKDKAIQLLRLKLSQ